MFLSIFDVKIARQGEAARARGVVGGGASLGCRFDGVRAAALFQKPAARLQHN